MWLRVEMVVWFDSQCEFGYVGAGKVIWQQNGYYYYVGGHSLYGKLLVANRQKILLL